MKPIAIDKVLSSFPEEFLQLGREEQKLSLHLYRLLAEGNPVPRESIPRAANLSEEVVNRILSESPVVYYDDRGRIIGYWGLALEETNHRFEVNGRTLYTWCAWDSLFIPELLNQTARVESECPATGEKIRLTVSPHKIEQCEPAGAVMSFLNPEAEKIREDVILHFCHYVHFFSSVEAGSRWVLENPGTFIMSIEEAYSLAQKKNGIKYYKDVLEAAANDRTF